jgi:hypothetical protein
MPPIEFTFFSVTLFLALIALLEWKRRRIQARERVAKGLKEFVTNTPSAPEQAEADGHDDESLVAAQ